MAPFPEDEIMTIKRLEVALKKSDFKLLKEGAYKLHEKYHSHHHFEYLDLLQVILDEVEANYAIPPEIKDILVPTIQDILNQDNEQEQNRVSSLTSLSYSFEDKQPENKQPEIRQPEFEKIERPKEENEFIKPFQEFTPIQPIEMVQNNTPTEDKEEYSTNLSSIAQTYDVEPTEDIITDSPVMVQQNIFEEPIEEPVKNTVEEPIEYLSYNENETENVTEEIKEEIQPIQETEPSIAPIPEFNSEFNKTEPYQEYKEEQKEDVVETIEDIAKEKSIAIFFGQDSSNEKIKNIIKYRELIHSQKEFSLNEITGLINEIKTQSDTNVSELQVILEKLKPSKHQINLITNSQSANFIDIFKQSEITYSIFNNSEDKRINLLPLFGLTNLYKCKECDNEYLDSNEKINSFILQCPKCKGAMLPDLYVEHSDINMDYYNSSIITLANSDTWLLIHPSLNEKLTLSMIRSAFKVSSKVKEVYIADKDINIRETYKKIFENINSNIKINNNLNVIEDFFLNI